MKKSKKYKVLMVGATNAGTVYHRFWKFAKYLPDDVIVLNYNPKSEENEEMLWEYQIKVSFDKREALYDFAREADIIIFQALNTKLSLGLVSTFRKALKIPVLAEIDDYILNIPPYNAAFDGYSPDKMKTLIQVTQMQESDGVVVSTNYLKEQYQQFNKNIHVVKNCIDLGEWNTPRPKKHKKIRIGWVGGATHSEDLFSIRDALEEVLKLPNVEFVCLGGVPNFLKTWKKVRWNKDWKAIDEYFPWVAQNDFDIGVFPLIDNRFNRAKSNLRYLEYAALKIPTVASDITPCKTIKHGKTGLVASTTKEWVDYLTLLIKDPLMRETLGKNAYSDIKNNYNAEKEAQNYHKLIRQYIKTKRKKK